MKVIVGKYGYYDYASVLESNIFCLKFEGKNNLFKYFREVSNSEVKSSIFSSKTIDNILIQPSEPLNWDFPKTFLMVEFKEAISLLPESELNGFVEIPISVAVIINVSRKSIPIDLFRITPLKFALYGNPHNGIICHYWKSEFYFNPFTPKIFETCLLEIGLQNQSSSLIKLTKLVFDFAYIQIFFNESLAKASSKVKIQSESYCETEFVKPIEIDNFQQSLDLIPTKFLSSSKFVMLNGL